LLSRPYVLKGGRQRSESGFGGMVVSLQP
jgi:hypothetical protein